MSMMMMMTATLDDRNSIQPVTILLNLSSKRSPFSWSRELQRDSVKKTRDIHAHLLHLLRFTWPARLDA